MTPSGGSLDAVLNEFSEGKEQRSGSMFFIKNMSSSFLRWSGCGVSPLRASEAGECVAGAAPRLLWRGSRWNRACLSVSFSFSFPVWGQICESNVEWAEVILFYQCPPHHSARCCPANTLVGPHKGPERYLVLQKLVVHFSKSRSQELWVGAGNVYFAVWGLCLIFRY